MDSQPLTVEGPAYSQLAKLFEERVQSAAQRRGVDGGIFQFAFDYSGTQLEDEIVSLFLKFHNAALFEEQIKAGEFDYVTGSAENSEEIEGQIAHVPSGESELDHPGVGLSSQEVLERYGEGDLSEFLDYAARHPDDQLEFSIGIVWKVKDDYWCAVLCHDGAKRGLSIYIGPSHRMWADSSRFIRKPSSTVPKA